VGKKTQVSTGIYYWCTAPLVGRYTCVRSPRSEDFLIIFFLGAKCVEGMRKVKIKQFE